MPFHVKAVTLMTEPPNCVSKETMKSPGVRLGKFGQFGFAGFVAGSA